AQNDKARPGQLPGPRKIHHAEALAYRLMRQWNEIEMRRLAMIAQYSIRALIRPIRHLFGGQVRQAGKDLIDLPAYASRRHPSLCLGLAVLRAPAQQRLDILATLLRGADLPCDAIAARLRLLGSGLSGAPCAVEG